MSIPNTSAQIQNFNGMGSSSTATLPTGFVVSQGTVYASGTPSTTQAAGTTGAGVLNGSSAGGTYNFANGITASATDRALGFLTSSGFTSPRSIMLELQNNTGNTITNLAITFDYEKYRSGSREFTWTFFSGTDGSTWTAQTAGDQPYEGDANNTTIYNPPTSTPKSVTISGLTIANGSKYYLRWTITGGGGSTNGQAIGIDNLSITATVCASQVTCYRDMDNDGYGNANNSQVFCMTCGTGYVSNNTDCIDTDASVHPGAMETCNGCDKDCDGFTGDGVAPIACGTTMPPNCAGQQTCIQQAVPFPGACLPGGGTLTACNNNPQPEVCDGLDNDCNTVVDDNLPPTPCIPPGVPTGLVYGGTSQCRQGFYDCSLGQCVGFVGPSEEVCDGIDNDCDGIVDDGVPGVGLQCEPVPGIVYGGNSPCQLGTISCINGTSVCVGGVDPSPEICDGIDNDCDGFIDNGCDPAEALDFDGENDWVSTALPDLFNNIGANDFTIETWVKLDAGGLFSRIMFAQKDGSNFTSLLVNAIQQIYFYVYRNGAQYSFNGPSIPLGQWTHIAARWVAATNSVSLYYNGVLQTNGGGGFSSNGTNNVFALGSKTDATQLLNGKLDEFRVWSKALSGTEIQTNMNCEIAGARANLVMNYHFNQGLAGGTNTGITTLLDDSGNGINGTLQNFALTGTNSNWIAPGAVTSGVACPCVLVTYYADNDHDGYGDPNVSQEDCSQPNGYVTDNTDCNDNDAAVHTEQLYYVDADMDGYGSTTTAMLCSATAPTGYSTNNTDCNDNDAAVHTEQLYYVDADLDGYGSTTTAMLCSTTAPTGYSTNNTDCNDNDAAVHTEQLYYVDADLDGYGSTTTAMLCSTTAPTGYSTNNTDCNDNNAAVHTEQLYYVDADLDGYGSTTTAMLCSATAPTGYSTNNTDCNDNDAAVHTEQLYYVDADLDGYGSTTTAMLCSATAPTGYSTNNTDCNDNNAAVHTEQLYYVDADLDGYGSTTTAMLCSTTAPTGYSTNNTDCNDNNAAVHTEQLYYVDADLDGYGSTTTAMLCSATAPTGYSTNNTDCNDNNAAIHTPQLYYVDADLDGYGSTTTAMLCRTTAPIGYSVNNTDCNDNDNTIYPGAPEICDNKDNDCNNEIDEPKPVPAPWATTGIGESGSSVLDPCPAGAPQFVVNATGFSPNVNNDAVQVTYQTLCGNSSITVHIAGVSGGGWAGITMRESTATGSKMVALKTQLTNFVRREARSITNGPKSTQQIPGLPPPSWLRIQRSGNIFSFYTSTNGTTWSLVGTQTIAMSNCLLVGMFAESINVNTTTTATFDNVSVSGAAPVITLAGVDNSGLELQAELDFTLYPNPTNGQLMIGFENAPTRLETVACTVYNTQGQEVLERNIAVHGQAETIDLSSLANGVYWLRIQGDNMTPGIRKVIKVDEIRP